MIEPAITRLRHIDRLRRNIAQDDPLKAYHDSVERILKTAFDSIQILRAEQAFLVQSGTFATTVSSIMGKLPFLEVLRITDKGNHIFLGSWGTVFDIARIVANDHQLLNTLVLPMP